jgi:hypothetical protein
VQFDLRLELDLRAQQSESWQCLLREESWRQVLQALSKHLPKKGVLPRRHALFLSTKPPHAGSAHDARKLANVGPLIGPQIVEQDHRLVASILELLRIHDHPVHGRPLHSEAWMTPREAEHQLHHRFKTPRALESRSTLFNLQALSGCFIRPVFEAQLGRRLRFQHSIGHGWEDPRQANAD